MIDTISSFLTSLFWPIPHIISTIRLTGKEPRPDNKAVPFLDSPGHAASFGASFRNFLIGYFIVFGLYDGNSYPAFGRAYTLSFDWMWPIVVRNLIGTWLLCGFWDYWLYFGPLRNKLYSFKIIPKYPSMAQMRHDVAFTTLSSFFAAVFEIVMCHCWATGVFPMASSLNEKPILHLLLALTISHWRLPHFYLLHRIIHPWKTDIIPDFGKFLYRNFHSLHHKSYNITAFSGTNMHPVESTLYYSAAFMCIPLGVHPSLAVGTLVDLAMSAWVGHDGHVYPGAADYYHALHHMHFDCNYGTAQIPFDYAAGTFISNKEDLQKIWGSKAFGRENNDTYVHEDSKSKKVE